MRNVQITRPCRIAISALADSTQMNYQRYGAIQSVIAAQHRPRIDDLDPHQECNRNRYSEVNGVPTLQFEYDPKTNNLAGSSTIDCTVGGQVSSALSGQFQMNRKYQLPVVIPATTWKDICCQTDEFFDAVNGERLKLKDDFELARKLKALGITGLVERAFNKNIDASFLTPIERDVLNTLIAGAGINPQTGTAAVVGITAINAQGQVTTQLNSLMNSIERKVNMCNGRWIILTGSGSRAIDYFTRCNISCCNTGQGLDAGAVVQDFSNKVQWYYSTEVDTLLGPDGFLLIAPQSVAGVFGNNFEYMSQTGKFGNTHFASMVMSSKYCQSQACVQQPDFTSLEFGLRMQEIDCPGPQANFWLDTQYGVWTQPAGFTYTYGPYVGYTGIVRGQFV